MDNGMDSNDSSIAETSKPSDAMETPKIVKDSSELCEILDYVNKEDKEKPYCVICDLQLTTDRVDDHLTSKQHVTEFHRQGCDGIEKERLKGYWCLYCLKKIRSPKRVYRHIKTKFHLKMASEKISSKDRINNVVNIPENTQRNNEIAPFIGISKLNDSTYICHLCDHDSGVLLNVNDVNNHNAGKRHRSFLPENLNKAKMGGTEVSKLSKNLLNSSIIIENSMIIQEYSAESIDSKETNSSEINLGIKAKMEWNSEMNYNDYAREIFHRRLFTSFFDKNITYFHTCFICVTKSGSDYSVFGKNKDKLLTAHIRGEQHGATMLEFGCDNIIAKAKKYYCQTCREIMNNRNIVYEHIQSENHLQLTKIILNDRMSFGVVSKDLFIYAIKQNSTLLADTYYCWICGEDNLYVPQKCLEPHLSSELHKDSLKKYGCKKIFRKNDTYYCGCCKTEFDNMKKVFLHVKEEDHMNRCEKKHEQRKTSELEKIDDNETELHCRLFTSFFDNNKPYFYICFICVTESETNYSVYGKNKDKLLNAHIRGESHGSSVVKFGCDKIVDKGKKYYCETCKMKITGRKQVLNHLQNENHLRLIKNLLNDRMNFDVVSDDFFIYAIKQKSSFIADTFYCWICDEDSYIPKKHLKAHLTSKLHKDSMKKYACQYIARRYDRYYCNCCEIEFDNMKNVFFHVKEENHIRKKNIVLLQEDNNMISNFTLEEELENKKTLSKLQSEINELETEKNTKIFIDDRDLSLHYILSNPKILCKGFIPKTLQKYVEKIGKQQVDNPYCLICNFEIPGYPAIDDHIKGKVHAESLLRNGCDKILQKLQKNTLRFVCELCNSDLRRIESVYSHIRTKSHFLKVQNSRPELFESQRKKTTKKNEGNLPLAPQTFTDLYKLQSSNFDSQAIVNEGNNEKPLNFNSIFSSISDDLSRMLAHLEIGSQAEGAKKEICDKTKNKNSVRMNNRKNKKMKKKRFAETSPESVDGDEDESADEENSENEEENSKIEEENSKIEEEKSKDSEESFPELIFR